MKVAEDGKKYLVRFEVGEKLPEKLVELALAHGWKCGSISGLGAVHNVTLGYFDLPTRTYVNHPIDGIVELISLVGNLSWFEDRPIWHMHAAVADRNGQLRGGHLMTLEVAVTVECWIEAGDRLITRKRDDYSGLNLLDL
jgi:uncharacterized protein